MMSEEPADLVSWLSAQLDADQRVAQKAKGSGEGRWEPDDPRYSAGITGDNGFRIYDEGGHSEYDAAHIASWDPARVLAEVEAKREILALHQPVVLHKGGGADYFVTVRTCSTCGGSDAWFDERTQAVGAAAWPCRTIRAVTQPYVNAGRPGWRVGG